MQKQNEWSRPSVWYGRPRKEKKIVKAAKIIGEAILFLMAIDFVILIFGLMQVAQGNASMVWSPFWRWQAEIIVKVLSH